MHIVKSHFWTALLVFCLAGCTSSGDLAVKPTIGNILSILTWGNVYEGEFVDGTGTGKVMFGPLSNMIPGSIYEGRVVHGLPSGKGTMTKPNGDFYEGDWVRGKKAGLGKYIWASGVVYEGSWEDGAITGRGKYTWSIGHFYEGDLVNSQQNGQGREEFANGDYNFGKWSDGQFISGIQKRTLPTGTIYEGDYSGLKGTGKGKMTWPDGNVYEGDFVKGWRTGKGKLTLANGDFLDGKWVNNSLKSGEVKITFANGSVYEGDWVDGKRTGKGKQTSASGNVYEGNFANGFRSGKGKYTWTRGDVFEGSIFEGDFDKGVRSGKGKYTWANGEVYEGSFRNGLPHGFGSLKNSNGDEYVGEFKAGKRHGDGLQTYEDGTLVDGNWLSDIFQNPKVDAPKSPPKIATDISPINPSDRKDTGNYNVDTLISASSGSGFAVSREGHVVTNWHVIQHCQEVELLYQGRSIPTDVITHDPQNDLALLKADFSPAAFLPISDSPPEILQEIYVAGFPFGKAVSGSVKVTKGIISSLVGVGNNFSNMQIDAALQPGNSGGPILNQQGNVVGVAVAKLDFVASLKMFDALPESTNFGVKASVVRSILQSNDVITAKANPSDLPNTELGKSIRNATLYLSCNMTVAQIAEMRSKKVLFETVK